MAQESGNAQNEAIKLMSNVNSLPRTISSLEAGEISSVSIVPRSSRPRRIESRLIPKGGA